MSCTRDCLIVQQGYLSVNWLIRCESYAATMPLTVAAIASAGLSRALRRQPDCLSPGVLSHIIGSGAQRLS